MANMVGFRRVSQWDRIAARFSGAQVIGHLPVDPSAAGANAAIRMAIDAVGAVYPQCNSERLAVVDDTGTVVQGPGNKIDLARMTGTARRTIVTALTHQKRVSSRWGRVVHL